MGGGKCAVGRRVPPPSLVLFSYRNLPADGVHKAQVGKLCPQRGDHGLAHAGRLVILLKRVALLLGTVAANGRHVEHAVAKLDEGAPFDGDLEVGDVVKDEIDETLQFGLAQVLQQGLDGQQIAGFVGDKAVLRKHVVVRVDGWEKEGGVVSARSGARRRLPAARPPPQPIADASWHEACALQWTRAPIRRPRPRPRPVAATKIPRSTHCFRPAARKS